MAEVTQADREAAWPTKPECFHGTGRERWDSGVYDKHSHIQSYAAHRIAAEKAVLDRFDEDWLSDIIQDSFEMDWTARDGARAIVRALALGEVRP